MVVESGDLTTHGAILGMTGSGKTGLGIVLLEEALQAGIPALILDPKGDMGNLLLTFPDLSPQDFRPWVNEDDARSAGLSLDDFAAKTAETWKEGLAAQGIGPDQIRRLRETADFAIYTPGSEAGIPLNVVGSLQAPALSWDTEAEALRDEMEGTVSSLLGLVGIEADPLSSREFVLLRQPARDGLAGRPGHGPRHADRPGADAAVPQARRVRPRDVLPAEGPHRAGPQAQRARCLAVVRGVGRGAAARPGDTPAHAGRAAAGGHRLPRAPLGGGATVRRHAGPPQARHLDAGPARPVRPQGPGLHGRGLRVRAADGGAAGEEADPHDPEAGPRLRRRDGALDPEPGGPRLQGDGERG